MLNTQPEGSTVDYAALIESKAATKDKFKLKKVVSSPGGLTVKGLTVKVARSPMSQPLPCSAPCHAPLPARTHALTHTHKHNSHLASFLRRRMPSPRLRRRPSRRTVALALC